MKQVKQFQNAKMTLIDKDGNDIIFTVKENEDKTYSLVGTKKGCNKSIRELVDKCNERENKGKKVKNMFETNTEDITITNGKIVLGDNVSIYVKDGFLVLRSVNSLPYSIL